MKKHFVLLAVAMLGISGMSRADLQECKFYGDEDVLIMSPGVQPVITPSPSARSPRQP